MTPLIMTAAKIDGYSKWNLSLENPVCVNELNCVIFGV